jgi:hypothetical protein
MGEIKMFRRFLLLGLVFIHNIALATMFFPLPIEKQVEEATSAAVVKLDSQRVFKNASGTIMTEYSFDVLESYNVSADDMDGPKLKLTMAGGTLNGVTSMIDGAPQFKADEKSFLLLKKIESKLYLSNFTLGKFKIQDYEGKTYYVSEVFPMDPQVGRISKDKMIELMKTKWKTTFTAPVFKLTPETENKVGSVPAAQEEYSRFEKRLPAAEDAIVEQGVPLFFWSALLLVAFFFTLIFVKIGQRGNPHKPE